MSERAGDILLIAHVGNTDVGDLHFPAAVKSTSARKTGLTGGISPGQWQIILVRFRKR